jgi:trigger factor
MVAEVARNKAIGIVLGKAKVVDTKGKAVDMSEFSVKPEEKKAKAEKADTAEKKPAAKKAPAKKPAAKK